jgi:hypothetical protein
MIFQKEDLFDLNLPVCTVCKKNVTPDQTSLTVRFFLGGPVKEFRNNFPLWIFFGNFFQITVGVIVHHTCMHCELCGDSFSGEAQSILRGGKVICSFCDTDLNPKCIVCEKYVFFFFLTRVLVFSFKRGTGLSGKSIFFVP